VSEPPESLVLTEYEDAIDPALAGALGELIAEMEGSVERIGRIVCIEVAGRPPELALAGQTHRAWRLDATQYPPSYPPETPATRAPVCFQVREST
jgi:hypothetical protein